MHPIELTAVPWQLRPVRFFNDGLYPRGERGWFSQQLPAHWQELPELRGHTGKTVYRTRFPLPAAARNQPARWWLRADGIFYWSRIFMNARDLGRHEGYFVPREHEVTGMLAGENELVVEVDCPDERRKSGKRMLTGVFSHWDALDPATNPGGIWLPVLLERSGPVRLRHAQLETVRLEEDAVVRWSVEVDALAALDIELRWTLAPHTFQGRNFEARIRRRLHGGVQRLEGELRLPEPRLWWTHDLGRPDLYLAAVELCCGDELSDRREFRFGVRTFELRDFIPYLNGQRFLVKGNNYPPSDARVARTTDDLVRQDLRMAQQAHINLLRIHAHVGHPLLYDAADELGVLLWQDFPMQWTYRRTVLPHARRQIAEMIRLLGNHPSVAVWCMHNEPIFITDTSDERIITGLRVYFSVFLWSWNRDVLDRRLARIARRLDTSRPVISNSGEYAVPLWHRGNDTHFYFGWYIIYGRLQGFDFLPFKFPKNVRFVTEFGAQSFPNLESSLRFMPDSMQHIDWKFLHRRYSFQGNVMAHWVDYKQNKTLNGLINQTQRYQSEINRYYIDRLRLHKYRPTGGIVPFMFVDPNPGITWSIVDYWRRPKRSYWALRDAFRPQYVFTIIGKPRYNVGEQIELPVYGVNDEQRAVSFVVNAVVCGPHGEFITGIQRQDEWDADCAAVELGRLRFRPDQRGDYEVRLRLEADGKHFENRYRVQVGRRDRQPHGLIQRISQALAELRMEN